MKCVLIVKLAGRMPTVLRIKGYRFFFYSNESDEPMHILEKTKASGKMWLNSPTSPNKTAGSNRIKK